MTTNLVIFSKDRACQLQATIDSVELHAKGFFDNIDVIYTHTSPAYEETYEVLKSRKPYINWVKQVDFQKDLKSLMKMDYTCYLADDDLLFGDIDKDLFSVFTDDVFCFSLRLGKNIEGCYSMNTLCTLKEYQQTGNYLVWDWRGAEYDFGYPLSVVGHIFRTDAIEWLSDRVSFINPNTYEGTLQSLLNEIPQPKMASYEQSVNFGVPANSVNASWTNRNGTVYSYTTQELNERYRSGQTIDVTKIPVEDIHRAQQEIPYEFK